MLGYLEAEKIITKARDDFMLDTQITDIDEVNDYFESENLFEKILIAVEEYLNIHQIEVDDFLKRFDFEYWSNWAFFEFGDNAISLKCTSLESYHKAIVYLNNCDSVVNYISVNHMDFFIENNPKDFYFFVNEVI